MGGVRGLWVSLTALVTLVISAGMAVPVFAASQPVSVSYATVDAVQMPAWLERAGQTQPLAVGMVVKNGDRIRTGADARAYLKLAEGSTVKLGENAALGFHSHSLKPTRNFKGALDVVTGAFRFTTQAVQRLHGQRDVSIRVGSAVIGIRGTDVWGKSDAQRDLVLLIEGHVDVRRAGQILEMSEPLTTFSVSRATAVETVASADPQQVSLWAQETDVAPGHGIAQPGGKWRVLLATFASQQEALAAYDQARAAGYAVQVKVRSAGDAAAENERQWNYDVVALNLASQQEAAALAAKISRQLGFATKVEK